MRSRPRADQRRASAAKVVVSFRARWQDLLRRVTAGEDVAAARADEFLAGSASARNKLARAFYGESHVRQIAGLDEGDVHYMLGTWLDDVVLYAFEEYEGSERNDYLAGISQTEYVTISNYHHGGRIIHRFPGEFDVMYDDLYERTAAGYSMGSKLHVMKSTGEVFAPWEARSTRAGIRSELVDGLRQDGDYGHWSIEFEAGESDHVVVANIKDTDYLS